MFDPENPDASTRYATLAAELSARIADGRWAPGQRLPALRVLCADHGLSPATVSHALHCMEDAGLIKAVPRRGFFVCPTVQAQGLPSPALPEPVALTGRRKRLLDLGSTKPTQFVSLGHLALPPALLPLTPIKRLMTQALRSQPELLAQGLVFGSLGLREQLARRSRLLGCDFSAEDLVVTQGETEAVELCLRQLCQPGDIVAVPSPGPMRVLEIIESLGLRLLEIPSDPQQGVSLDALAFALQHHKVAACVIEPSFASADGSLMPEANKRRLADMLAQHQLPLIECDSFGELYRGAHRPPPVKAYDRGDWVLYCASLICHTGMGCTAAYVASHRHHELLRAARMVHGEYLSGLIDRTLAEFLSGGQFEAHARQLRRRLLQQVRQHAALLRASFPAGTQVSEGQGGYVLWLSLPAPLQATALLQKARDAGYSFLPGEVFGQRPELASCLRLSAAQPLDAARAQGLKTLGALACELAGVGPTPAVAEVKT